MPLKRLYHPDLPLFELLKIWPEMTPVFFRHQMVCVGCLVSQFHTVTDACVAYGLNVDAFYAELAQTVRLPPAHPKG